MSEIIDFIQHNSKEVAYKCNYSVFKQYGLQNSLCDILQKNWKFLIFLHLQHGKLIQMLEAGTEKKIAFFAAFYEVWVVRGDSGGHSSVICPTRSRAMLQHC